MHPMPPAMPSPSTTAFDNAFGMAFEMASGNAPEKLNVRE
jgi:hypothetical protein